MNQEPQNIESNDSQENIQLNGRRDFIKKFGKYGVATPVAITTLMAPGSKAAAASGEETTGGGGGFPFFPFNPFG